MIRWAFCGGFSFLLIIPTSISAATRYVDVNSTNPVTPYTNWATAANVIQDAVDAAMAGDTVWVTNGVYDTGGKAMYGTMTNRVAVDKPLTLLSVNGPEVTVIMGEAAPNGLVGDGAIRCAYVGTNAVLSGFTLTNGRTRMSGDADREQSGGGAWCEASGMLTNCMLRGNWGYSYGGGAYDGTLYNCTLTGNISLLGGGTAWGTLNNCTLCGNSSRYVGGAYYGTLNNCIVFFNSSANVSNYRFSEFNNSCTSPMPTNGVGNITNAPLFVDTNNWSDLHLQSNSPCINAGDNAYVATTTDLDGNPRIQGGTVDMGAYEFQSPEIHYVDVNNAFPSAPFTNWATAANVIQDAVDVAEAGDVVLVTNGVYSTGGKAVYGTMTNRVAVDKPLTLMSVNGPIETIIEGQGPRGPAGIRCVYLTNGASLNGFTLTNGATLNSGDNDLFRSGAGVWCESTNVWVSDCLIVSCDARQGGGTFRGTLNRCVVRSNLASIGAGAFGATLYNCLIVSNFSEGALSCHLTGCTLVANMSVVRGGGASEGSMDNCICFWNTTIEGQPNHYGVIIRNSCTTPLPSMGVGNITNAPLFVDTNDWSDLHLQSNSPCINAGNNAYVTATNDLDGNPRIVGGTVDMGAYEFQFPQSSISYAWLQQFGLPTDGSVDDLDGDNDLATTWQEWKMWTDPTNELSVLRLLNPQAETNGTMVSWESVEGHSYFLERSTNAAESFSLLQGNIVGQAGMTGFTDTTATNGELFLYRAGVSK